MPGYLLIERQYLSPPKPPGQGIKANSVRIGFSDFLRELENDPFPYDENSSVLVYNLEDLLLYGRSQDGGMEEMARRVHQKLQRVAGDFERNNCPWVQIEIKYKLVRGEKLWVQMRPEDEPIHLIFGSPPAEDENGNIYYKTSFNLSAPR